MHPSVLKMDLDAVMEKCEKEIVAELDKEDEKKRKKERPTSCPPIIRDAKISAALRFRREDHEMSSMKSMPKKAYHLLK